MPDLDERIREELQRSANSFEPEAPLSLPGVHERARALRTRLLVSTLIVALLIASGAFFVVHAVSKTQPGSFVGPNGASNKAIAQAEVAHLLDIVNVPPGSQHADPPAGASKPTSARSQNVSDWEWWTVPMPMRDAFEWIFHHHPAGTHLLSWGTGKNGKIITTWGATWSADDTNAYVQPEIEVDVFVISPSISRVQVIASATWLGPPAVDRGSPNEQRVRVEKSLHCPMNLSNNFDVINPPNPQLRKTLVFPGNPLGGMRCVYSSTNALLTTTRLDASAASTVANKISQIILGSPGPGYFHSCPTLGQPDPTRAFYEIVVLQYPGKPDVDLLQGIICLSLDNGFIQTSIIPIPVL